MGRSVILRFIVDKGYSSTSSISSSTEIVLFSKNRYFRLLVLEEYIYSKSFLLFQYH